MTAPKGDNVLDHDDVKARQRAMWALGDYHGFATAALWDLGPVLVEACGIGPGLRVLDVAAGSGNVAIRAAAAGADVVASDLTPENFDAGRRAAAEQGVRLEWVQADAEALPFPDDAFDVVTSAVGAIFAPRHERVADELLRVCRPGGTIGLIALVPGEGVLDLFDLLNRYSPSPWLDARAMLQWGREAHVRALFGDRVASLEFQRRALAPDALTDLGLLKTHHPAYVALCRDLADQPDRLAALDRELAQVVRRFGDEPQEVLVIVARERA